MAAEESVGADSSKQEIPGAEYVAGGLGMRFGVRVGEHVDGQHGCRAEVEDARCDVL